MSPAILHHCTFCCDEGNYIKVCTYNNSLNKDHKLIIPAKEKTSMLYEVVTKTITRLESLFP